MKGLPKFFLLLLLIASPAAHAAITSTNSYPLQIVTCRKDVDMAALLEEFQIKLINPKHKLRMLKVFFAPLDAAMVQRLKADDRVLAVEADGPVSLCGQINPTGLVRMGIDRFPIAHINGIPKPLDVGVAVMDTGITPQPDLNVYSNYCAYCADDLDGIDWNYHGTGVAGIIGATDNGFGIVGVAPGVRIWNVKVIGPPPNDAWSNVLGGIEYILEHANEISVVNMSFVNESANAPTTGVRLYVRDLVSAGIVVVAGAGNSARDLAGLDGIYGTNDDPFPAAYSESMAVSAMDPTNDTVWAGSNFSQVERTNIPSGASAANYVVSPGGAIDVAAPGGVGIPTTFTNGGYILFGGTSAAAPHVTGLVALYIAANGRATNAAGVYRIRQAIIDASLPQSQWNTNNTHDPDTNPEPLAIATETWVPQPVITNTAGAPGNFQVHFATVPGYDYTVQSATNLTPPVAWTNLATVSGSSNVAPASVTDSRTGDQNFYRLARKASVAPPVIVVQPGPTALKPAGTTANLNVSVSGTPPFSYLWQKDGSPLADGGNVSGATTPSLVLTNLQAADAGAYQVVVTNAAGSVTSTVVSITVLTNWTSATVTGVLATATSEIAVLGYYASNTVTGSIGSIWASVGINQGFGEDRNPAITFDLGTVRRLENTVVWNEAGPWNASGQDSSVKRMIIEVSNDGVSFSSLGEFTLTTLSPASETLPLYGVAGRYVRFTIRENGKGQLFPAVGTPVGYGIVILDEVVFHEYLGN